MGVKICQTCGAELLSIDGGYRCLYCRNGFVQSGSEPNRIVRSASLKSDRGADVFERNVNGVLEITWSDGTVQCSGSGLLLTADGYALTNTHVVTSEDGTSCGRVCVRIAGEEVEGTVERLGDDHHGLGNGVDLALVRLDRVPRGAQTLHFADFDTVRNGEKVYVIGNSLGLGTCITGGIVSDRRRVMDGDELLMTDCAVNGGNSGGPIFNERGEVIGVIVSGISRAEGMNFAIPADVATSFCGGLLSAQNRGA